jgi:hypothetical protein
VKNRRTIRVMFDLTCLQRIGPTNPGCDMPSGGSSDIGAVVDGFTNGCAKGLSGDCIQGPADVSGVNPPDIGAGMEAFGCSGAGANAGPANEDEASSHGSSNDGGTAFPVPASSGERFNAELVKLCAKAGCRKTTTETATKVTAMHANRVKLPQRSSFTRDFVFIARSFKCENPQSRIAATGQESLLLEA